MSTALDHEGDPFPRRLLLAGGVVLAIAALALAALLASEFGVFSLRVGLHLFLCAGGIGTWLLARRGLLRPAATLLIGSYWLGVTFVVFINGGVRGPNLVNYPLILLLSGWLLGTRGMLVVSAFTWLLFMSLLALDGRGLIPPANFDNKAAYAVFLTAITVMIAGATWLLRKSYQLRLQQSQRVAQELREHRARLEHEVQARTAELSIARDRADAANRAKSSFLANMSHEIRTPLNVITGMAHIIRQEGLAPAQGQQLDKLERASRHLLQVINDVLDLSKIEAGKMSLELADLQVERVVRNVAALLAERADARGIALRVEPGDAPAVLEGDALRLQQALLNYGSNAIKFTEQGSVTLRARVQSGDADSVLLRFEVEDTGPGLEPAALERLFAPFEQGDNSTTRRHGGTGLGLTITRQLAGLMGGEAGARSTPGVGSTFWFTARLRRPSTATVPVLAEPSADPATRVEALRRAHPGLRVLVVDDDPVNLEIAAWLLAQPGWQVDEASDGEQAVALAARGGHGAILMDVQMPGIDGLQATRLIRALPGCATLPIIALTGNAFREDHEQCLRAGMSTVINKPVEPAELYAVLLAQLLPGGAAQVPGELAR